MATIYHTGNRINNACTEWNVNIFYLWLNPSLAADLLRIGVISRLSLFLLCGVVLGVDVGITNGVDIGAAVWSHAQVLSAAILSL